MLKVIEATMNGKSKGDVLIPRLPVIPTDMPFEFKRLEFPVRLAFSMTVNKAQVDFNGPVVIILATGSEIRGFKPFRGRCIFSERKNSE